MSTSFWINDPSILINEKYILNFWPLENMSQNQKLNSISRLVIILTIIGTLITQSFRMAVTGIITLGVIVLLYFIQNKNKSSKEAFSSINLIKNNYVPPTESNPLMNVPLTDYKDNPERKPAAPAFNPIIEEKINEKTQNFVVSQFNNSNEKEDEYIKSRLFQDLGDNFVFNQSMRNFYSAPNTTIPNDQKAFSDFCFGEMTSCKEGDPIACSRWDPRWIDGNQ